MADRIKQYHAAGPKALSHAILSCDPHTDDDKTVIVIMRTDHTAP